MWTKQNKFYYPTFSSMTFSWSTYLSRKARLLQRSSTFDPNSAFSSAIIRSSILKNLTTHSSRQLRDVFKLDCNFSLQIWTSQLNGFFCVTLRSGILLPEKMAFFRFDCTFPSSRNQLIFYLPHLALRDPWIEGHPTFRIFQNVYKKNIKTINFKFTNLVLSRVSKLYKT